MSSVELGCGLSKLLRDSPEQAFQWHFVLPLFPPALGLRTVLPVSMKACMKKAFLF